MEHIYGSGHYGTNNSNSSNSNNSKNNKQQQQQQTSHLIKSSRRPTADVTASGKRNRSMHAALTAVSAYLSLPVRPWWLLLSLLRRGAPAAAAPLLQPRGPRVEAASPCRAAHSKGRGALALESRLGCQLP